MNTLYVVNAKHIIVLDVQLLENPLKNTEITIIERIVKTIVHTIYQNIDQKTVVSVIIIKRLVQNLNHIKVSWKICKN